jgi:hypothetical protein
MKLTFPKTTSNPAGSVYKPATILKGKPKGCSSCGKKK